MLSITFKFRLFSFLSKNKSKPTERLKLLHMGHHNHITSWPNHPIASYYYEIWHIYSIQLKSHTNHTLAGWCKLYSRVISDNKLTPTKQKNHELVYVFSTAAQAAPSFTTRALRDSLPFFASPLSSNIVFFFLIMNIISSTWTTNT